MKMNYSDMFDCISDKSAEILNEYEEYELVQRIINNCYIKPMPLPLH